MIGPNWSNYTKCPNNLAQKKKKKKDFWLTFSSTKCKIYDQLKVASCLDKQAKNRRKDLISQQILVFTVKSDLIRQWHDDNYEWWAKRSKILFIKVKINPNLVKTTTIKIWRKRVAERSEAHHSKRHGFLLPLEREREICEEKWGEIEII